MVLRAASVRRRGGRDEPEPEPCFLSGNIPSMVRISREQKHDWWFSAQAEGHSLSSGK